MSQEGGETYLWEIQHPPQVCLSETVLKRHEYVSGIRAELHRYISGRESELHQCVSEENASSATVSLCPDRRR